MGMSIAELDLETSEYLPRREVMTKCCRSRCGNDYYYEHEDNDVVDDSFNGNNISVLTLGGDTNQNSGLFFGEQGGGGSLPWVK
jgi:hypothetical protein